LYFYVRPSTQFINGSSITSPLDLFNRINVRQVIVTKPNNTTTTDDYTGLAIGGLPMAVSNGSTPRLFHVGSLGNSGAVNNASMTVRVVCEFDCSDPVILAQLTTSNTDANFPFEIGVNYNCSRDRKICTEENAEDWTNNSSYDGTSYASNELTWELARQRRCSNDRILNVHNIDAPTVDFDVAVIPSSSYTPCNPVFDVVVTNTSNGEITLDALELDIDGVLSTPNLSPAPTSLANNASYTYVLTPGVTGCSSTTSINVTAKVSPFCAPCIPNGNCTHVTKSGSLDNSSLPNVLALAIGSVNNPSCGASNGSIGIDVSGGCGPYDFYLSTDVSFTTIISQTASPVQANTYTFSGLAIGTYYIKVVDANGCEEIITYVLAPSPIVLDFTLTHTNVECFGETNGKISVSNVVNGTGPYIYQLCTDVSCSAVLQSSSSAQTGVSFLNLPADDYYVRVTDVNGCSKQIMTTVDEPSLLTVSLNATGLISCNGANDGSIDVTASQGTSPYTYNWTSSINNFTSSSEDITGLGSDIYILTVTDANGCVASLTHTIFELAMASMNISVLPPAIGTTFCENDTINLQATQGYTDYQWNFQAVPNSILGTADMLAVTTGGTYCVSAIDQNMCPTAEACLPITYNPGPQITNVVTPIDVCLNAKEWMYQVDAYGQSYSSFFSSNGLVSVPTTNSSGFSSFVWPGSNFVVFVFDPSLAGVGSHVITNTVTDPVTGCVTQEDIIINVLGGPVVTAPSIPDIHLCAYNDTPIQLPVATTTGTNCSISGVGVSNGTFDPSIAGAGTHVITYSCSNACGTTSETTTVKVIDGGVWHQSTKNTTGSELYNDVVIDAAGNVYSVGTFTNTTVVDGGGNNDITLPYVGVPMSAQGTFLTKYDPCGNLLWVATTSSNTVRSTGNGIALDEAKGLVYITGGFDTRLSFLSAVGNVNSCPNTLVSAIGGINDGYVAQFDMITGCVNFVSDLTVASSNIAEGHSVDVRKNSQIYVCGDAQSVTTPGVRYAFVNKYAPTTNVVIGGGISTSIWSVEASQGNISSAHDLDFVSNRVWVVGDFRKSIQFTGLSNNTSLTAVSDAFLLGLIDIGTVPFQLTFRRGNVSGNSSTMTANSVKARANGWVFVTGSYNEAIQNPFQTVFPWNINSLINTDNSINAYMIGLNFNTSTIWSRRADPGTAFQAEGTSVDFRDDKVYFAGNFNDDILVQSMPSSSILGAVFPYGHSASSGQRNYMSCYSETGAGLWTNVSLGGEVSDHRVNGVAANSSGKIFTVGTYADEMSFLFTGGATNSLMSSAIPASLNPNAFIVRTDMTTGETRFALADDESETVNLSKTDYIKVVPNPTNGQVELIVPNLPSYGKLTILSIEGEVLRIQELSSTITDVDLTNFESGMYLFRVEYDNNAFTAKVVRTN